MFVACGQGARFARARQTGVFGPSFRVGLAGSCLRQVSSQAAMAPPSDVSWDALQQTIREQHPDIVATQENTAEGPPSPMALIRTFGSSEEPRVKLYRDHAAWCPYCHKVWMMLEEKKIPYTVEKINMRCYGEKPDSFLAKVPRGLLPVLELDGQVITESSQIMNVLEKEFPENPMLPPAGTPEAKRAKQLMQLERQLFGEWMGWLTSGGWGHDNNRAKFNRVLRLCDDQLQASKGSFFMGKQLTLVDLAFVPFVERMVSSLLYYKGFAIRGTGMFPGIDTWFEALEKRPSYLAARSDHYTHCHNLPPQLGGCQMHKDGEQFAKQINGRDGKNWHLPLAPLTATSQPECYSPGDNLPTDRALAAFRLVNNHAAVAKFAARGAGEEGPVPVWAPLSDPSAIPNENVAPYVEKSLSVVAQALMEGTETDSVQSSLAAVQAELEPAALTKDVCLSLQYLRDRVGVPRDMPLPAGRQLRAHLNWCIDKLST